MKRLNCHLLQNSSQWFLTRYFDAYFQKALLKFYLSFYSNGHIRKIDHISKIAHLRNTFETYLHFSVGEFSSHSEQFERGECAAGRSIAETTSAL